MRKILLVAAIVVGLGILTVVLCYTTPLSYIYCTLRENSWLAAKTEAQLDRRMLAFYTKHSIPPSASGWGHDYVLQPGQRMTQYLVFSKEPFDVVFDSQSRVVAAFTSYE